MKMIRDYYKPRADCQIPGLENIYAGVFGLTNKGAFVEVGAFDGASYSNTVFLAEIGWEGLYIEGIKGLYDRCVENHKNHPNVKIVHALVGDGSNVIIRHDGELYSGDLHLAASLGAREVIGTFPTITLNSILRDDFRYGKLDILVIDVEGMEPKVLSGFELEYWEPKLVIVETHEYHENEKLRRNAKAIDDYFLNDNNSGKYIKIYTSQINTVYLRT